MDPTVDNHKALKYIQGENYSHYVHPTRQELANCGQALIQETLDSVSPEDCMVVERCTVHALQAEARGVWESSADKDSKILLLPEQYSPSLFRAKKGHCVFVTPSFFIMFAENVSIEACFWCVKAYLTLMQLLFKTGNVSKEHLEHNRRILCSFLMALDFGNSNNLQQDDTGVDEDYMEYCNDDNESYNDSAKDNAKDKKEASFILARRLALANGYCKGAMPRVLAVSMRLGIGHSESLFLQVMLGKEHFKELLLAYNILLPGQTESPMELSYKCPGCHQGEFRRQNGTRSIQW